jgi:hypothetical protein
MERVSDWDVSDDIESEALAVAVPDSLVWLIVVDRDKVMELAGLLVLLAVNVVEVDTEAAGDEDGVAVKL